MHTHTSSAMPAYAGTAYAGTAYAGTAYAGTAYGSVLRGAAHQFVEVHLIKSHFEPGVQTVEHSSWNIRIDVSLVRSSERVVNQ